MQKPIVFLGWRSNNKVTRSKSWSNWKIAITRLIFNVQRRKAYWHNLWAIGHFSNALQFWFRFRYEYQQRRHPALFLQLNGTYMVASIWLQIWNLRGKLCQMQQFLCLWRHCWRLSRSSKWPLFIHCIFPGVSANTKMEISPQRFEILTPNLVTIWPQILAITRIFVWIFIFEIDWNIAILVSMTPAL